MRHLRTPGTYAPVIPMRSEEFCVSTKKPCQTTATPTEKS
ncbi:hypothetical protein A464_224 [Salmonella bongori N268-08]|uniref:Uncharacterized protein n=1 Tax=Salmonella bongori N268-08 TaxID=1197719 RepID=S5N4M9_SALBN|nr:hypothetical protein A464_224 [Salmonella bongori N268-08]